MTSAQDARALKTKLSTHKVQSASKLFTPCIIATRVQNLLEPRNTFDIYIYIYVCV